MRKNIYSPYFAKALKLLLIPLLLCFYSCARKDFYAPSPVADPTVYQKFKEASAPIDSVTVKAGEHYARGFIYRTFWGTRHRPAWSAPVVVPVLDLKTHKGGLKVEKIGGGMQTISATLVSSNGRTYSLRSVDKYPEVKLPFPFQNLFVADLIRDQTSALHPYAALVVAPLSEAAGITHPDPVLFYVRPNEKALGEHQSLLSNRLYILEEKFNDKRALTGALKDAVDIVSTKKMLNYRDDDGNHKIDQVAFAKARLLDLLIGDRDRHEEQWEWAVYKNQKAYIYRPIPKDRDNAFFRFDDGLFSWLLSRKWAQRKFVTFYGDFRDVRALMIKSAYIDARALPQVTVQQFDSLARELQGAITDKVIEDAVRKLPEQVYKLDGETLTQQLKSRRNTLHLAAREFYEALAEKVQIRGTHNQEVFKIIFRGAKETDVIVQRKSDGNVLYQRTFYHPQTRELALFGLGANDEFTIQGEPGKSIKIDISGGKGEDTFHVSSQAKKKLRKVKISDVETIQ